MAMTPKERQARYRERLKKAADNVSAYEVEILQRQVEQLTEAVNGVRKHVGLPEIQLVKSAYKPRD